MLHDVGHVSRPIGPYRDNITTPESFELLVKKKRWTEFRFNRPETGDVLTFDDGCNSIFNLVLPILEKYRVPAIVFMTTGFISGEFFPYEMDLANLLAELDCLRWSDGQDVVTVKESHKEILYQRLRTKIRCWLPSQQRAFVDGLAKQNQVEIPRREEDRFLSWGEVAELDRHPLITIGAHTHSHPVLSKMNPLAAFREIRRSKIILEDRLGHAIELFAYPYGAQNVIIRKLVRLAGFKYAFTTQPKVVDDWRSVDPMAIPRFDINDLRVGSNEKRS